jgi:hypothetical protein
MVDRVNCKSLARNQSQNHVLLLEKQRLSLFSDLAYRLLDEGKRQLNCLSSKITNRKVAQICLRLHP